MLLFLGKISKLKTFFGFSKKSRPSSTITDKVIYSISRKKWGSSSEILFELNSVLQFLVHKGKLNEFETQELALVLLELKEIEHLNTNGIISISRLKQLINSFIKEISVSYKSKKDSKINFMGLLESRALDFETVILTSVNEGVMPKARSYPDRLVFLGSNRVVIMDYKIGWEYFFILIWNVV